MRVRSTFLVVYKVVLLHIYILRKNLLLYVNMGELLRGGPDTTSSITSRRNDRTRVFDIAPKIISRFYTENYQVIRSASEDNK